MPFDVLNDILYILVITFNCVCMCVCACRDTQSFDTNSTTGRGYWCQRADEKLGNPSPKVSRSH